MCEKYSVALLVSVNFTINWQQTRWQFPLWYLCVQNEMWVLGKLQLTEWVILVTCSGHYCQPDHAGAWSQSNVKRAMAWILFVYAGISKHHSCALFCNTVLFVGRSAYRHLCYWNDCKGRYLWVEPFLLLACVLFCSYVSSCYVEASLQRDGGSVTAAHSVLPGI